MSAAPPTARWPSCAARAGSQRPPPPPPPPPPPEKPPPPPPEELPGGVDDEAICEVRLLPIALPSEPRSVVPAPWYQVMPLAATATAAAPTARDRKRTRRNSSH